MLKSMTAYGRSKREVALGSFLIEIQSVNRKHLDIQIACSLPALTQFETDIKKMVSGYIQRGQINLKITVRLNHASCQGVLPNIVLAKQMKEAWEILAKELSIPFDSRELWHAFA